MILKEIKDELEITISFAKLFLSIAIIFLATNSVVAQYDTLDFISVERLPDFETDNSFTVDGIGQFNFADYQLLLDVEENGESAYLKVQMDGTEICKVSGIVSISKFRRFQIDSNKKVLSFVGYTHVLDHKSEGRLYTIISENGQSDVYTRNVDNATAPIIVDDRIVIIESLQLKQYSLSLDKVFSENRIIYFEELRGNFEYLDTYSVGDLRIYKKSIFIDFSINAFKADYKVFFNNLNEVDNNCVILLGRY